MKYGDLQFHHIKKKQEKLSYNFCMYVYSFLQNILVSVCSFACGGGICSRRHNILLVLVLVLVCSVETQTPNILVVKSFGPSQLPFTSTVLVVVVVVGDLFKFVMGLK